MPEEQQRLRLSAQSIDAKVANMKRKFESYDSRQKPGYLSEACELWDEVAEHLLRMNHDELSANGLEDSFSTLQTKTPIRLEAHLNEMERLREGESFYPARRLYEKSTAIIERMTGMPEQEKIKAWQGLINHTILSMNDSRKIRKYDQADGYRTTAVEALENNPNLGEEFAQLTWQRIAAYSIGVLDDLKQKKVNPGEAKRNYGYLLKTLKYHEQELGPEIASTAWHKAAAYCAESEECLLSNDFTPKKFVDAMYKLNMFEAKGVSVDGYRQKFKAIAAKYLSSKR